MSTRLNGLNPPQAGHLSNQFPNARPLSANRYEADWLDRLRYAADSLRFCDICVPSTPMELRRALETLINRVENRRRVSLKEYRRLHTITELMGWGSSYEQQDPAAKFLYKSLRKAFCEALQHRLFTDFEVAG